MSDSTKHKYRTAPLRSLHKVMEDLFAVGAIGAKQIKQFDKGCLTGAACRCRATKRKRSKET